MNQAIQAEADLAAVSQPRCTRCGRKLRPRWGFAFKVDPTLPSEVLKCVLCALRHGPLFRRSLTVALVVGTILVLLNQGDTILGGHWKTAFYWKIPLTYVVPYCVATFGALTNSRR